MFKSNRQDSNLRAPAPKAGEINLTPLLFENCLTLRFQVSRYIGFFPFNKPAGLTLFKKVKLRGASVTWLYSYENLASQRILIRASILNESWMKDC
jgi:hypothetical protein